MKVEIYGCSGHDHHACFINGEPVFQNDYCIENVRRICYHFGWFLHEINLTDEEFEERFA